MSSRIALTLIVASALFGTVACDAKKADDKAASSASTATKPATPPSASASTAKSATAAAEPAGEPTITIVPMKFVPTDAKPGAKTIELAADGSVKLNGEVVAKFVKNSLEDKDGKALFTLAKDGTLTGHDVNKKAVFNAADELEVEGEKVAISDDGVMTSTKGGKTDKAPITIEGFKKEGKRAAIIVVGFVMFHGGGGESAEVAPDGPAIVIAPMKLVSTDAKTPGPAVELLADGTVKAGPEVVAKFVKNTLQDKNGRLLVAVDKDGNLVGKDVHKKAGFNAKNELVGDEGKGTLFVADDGTITLTEKGKPEKPGLKFEGFKKEARRAGTLMAVVMLMMKGGGHASPAPLATSAPPVLSAAPPSTGKPH